MAKKARERSMNQPAKQPYNDSLLKLPAVNFIHVGKTKISLKSRLNAITTLALLTSIRIISPHDHG